LVLLEDAQGLLHCAQLFGHGDFDIQVGQEAALVPEAADRLLNALSQSLFEPLDHLVLR
jgi:hypothetical protein